MLEQLEAEDSLEEGGTEFKEVDMMCSLKVKKSCGRGKT